MLPWALVRVSDPDLCRMNVLRLLITSPAAVSVKFPLEIVCAGELKLQYKFHITCPETLFHLLCFKRSETDGLGIGSHQRTLSAVELGWAFLFASIFCSFPTFSFLTK